MDLYGITIRYVQQKARPVLDHAHVDRETARYYLVSARREFLSYRSRIEKSSNTFGFSPLAAWKQYVNKCNQLRVELRLSEEAAGECQRIAMAHIMELEGVTK